MSEGQRRETERFLTEIRGQLDEGLARLNAALQHRNFVRQRLAEIELNGIHSCWRAAANVHHLLNGVRPPDVAADATALAERIEALGAAHNTLLALFGKYDPFLDSEIRRIVEEVAKLARLELSQARRDHFSDRWWEQGDKNREAIENHMAALRTAVQGRVATLRELANEGRP